MYLIEKFRRLSFEQKLGVILTVAAFAAIGLHFAGLLGGGSALLFAVSANSITNPTLADVVRQEAPKGGLLPIVEALSKLTPFLNDATWLACNNGTFHRINRRNVLPAPVRRRINKGVAATKSGTQQVDEITTMLADKSAIDATLIRMMGPEYRAREVAAHMMGFSQQVESDLLVGSIGSDPDGIDGIETRLSATTNTPGGNQVIKVDASPSGSDQGSILLVGWAPHGVHGVYPAGLPGGLMHKDYGEVSNGGTDGTNTFPAFVDYFEWHHGLAVEDFRYCARASNIDSSALSGTGTNLIDALITLHHRCLTDDASARWAYYMPRTFAEFLHKQARSGVTNSTLRIQEIAGQEITLALGHPIRTADLMTITESIVS